MGHQAKALLHDGPFSLRICPEPCESLFGFALRLCDRVTLDRGSPLLRLIGARTMRPPFPSTAVERLARLSMRSFDELQRMQPERLVNGEFLFLGHQVARTSIAWEALRFCPNCLQEKQIYRQIWDYRAMTVCAEHHVRILECCPVCELPVLKGRGIQWWMKCPRGHDLALIAATRPIRSMCSQYVEWRFGPSASVPSIFANLPSALPTAKPDAVISLARFLGGIARARARLERLDAPWPADVILEEGFVILTSWPDRLEQDLEALHRASPKHLFPAEFRNWLRRSWRRAALIDGSHPIGQQLATFSASKGFFLDPAELGVPDVVIADRLPAHLACRATGLGSVAFREMIREDEWSGWQGVCSGLQCCLLRADLTAWLKRNEQHISIAEAARALGCRVKDVIDMARNGCFGDQAGLRLTKGATVDRFLFLAEIAGLLDRLRDIVPSGTSKKQSTSPVSLSKACFDGDPRLADLINGVLNGNVVAIGWREPLLSGLLLNAKDVAAYRSLKVRQSSG